MSDVHLDDEGAELERELLASWKTMTAPDEARKKALGALAVGTAAVVATQAVVVAGAGGKVAATKSVGALANLFAKIAAKISAGFNLGGGAAATTGATTAAAGVTATGAAAATAATGIVAKTVIVGAVVASTVVGVEVSAPIVRERLSHHATSGEVVASPGAGAARARSDEGAATFEEPSSATPPHEAIATEETATEAARAAEATEAAEVVQATEVRPEANLAPSEAPRSGSGAAKDKPQVAATNMVAEEAAPTSAPQAKDDLTNGLRAIEAGRKALANRNPAAAIEHLTIIGAGSPLAAEAMALRFDAYTRAGDHEAARAVAKKLVTSFPDSPYASRMRRALEGAN